MQIEKSNHLSLPHQPTKFNIKLTPPQCDKTMTVTDQHSIHTIEGPHLTASKIQGDQDKGKVHTRRSPASNLRLLCRMSHCVALASRRVTDIKYYYYKIYRVENCSYCQLRCYISCDYEFIFMLITYVKVGGFIAKLLLSKCNGRIFFRVVCFIFYALQKKISVT